MTNQQAERYGTMSAELTDLRTKITSVTAQVLAGINMATGEDRSQIAREALHEWAVKKVHAARMIERLTRGEGGIGASMPSEDQL